MVQSEQLTVREKTDTDIKLSVVNEVHNTLRDIEHPLDIDHDTIHHTVRHTEVIEPSSDSINEGTIQADKIATSLRITTQQRGTSREL